MNQQFPIRFNLSDGTHITVYKESESRFEFLMTRLNSEKHNFMLIDGKIEESYETRFDKLQEEAVNVFRSLQEG